MKAKGVARAPGLASPAAMSRLAWDYAKVGVPIKAAAHGRRGAAALDRLNDVTDYFTVRFSFIHSAS
jgi:hypothetical protein